MKIFIFISIFSIFQVSAKVYSQKSLINLKEENKSIESILEKISTQTEYKFFYSNDELNVDKKVNIDISNKDVNEALKIIFKGANCKWKIDEHLVLIYCAPTFNQEQENSKKIEGTVLDANNKPLPGVSIVIEGTINGVSTNIDGKFLLHVKGIEKIVLKVSCIGFKTQKVVYNGKPLKIIMHEKKEELGQVVVNGYFSKRKESYTGNAIVLKSEDILKVSNTNIVSALQVFDPSIQLVENNELGSNPNALPDFRIRGNSGIGNVNLLNESNLRNNPNLPTFILDGYEVSVEKIYDLDLTRIESMTILKDASATAIYGSRAANGVIVVKTKAPKKGELRVSYNTSIGFIYPDLTDYNLLNAKEKLKAEELAGVFTSKYYSSEVQLRQDYNDRVYNILRGVDTYWLSQPLKSTITQNHSLYVEGGSKQIKSGIGVNFNDNPGVMKGSKRDRFGVDFKLSYNYKDKLLFRNNVNIRKVKSADSPYGNFSDYALANPYYPIRDMQGNIIKRYKLHTNYTTQFFNPIYESTLNNKSVKEYTEWSNNFDLDWFILESLRLKTRVTYSERVDQNNRFIDPNSSKYRGSDYYGGEGRMKKGEAWLKNSNQSKFEANMVLSYNKKMGENYFMGVIGGNIMETNYEDSEIYATGFPNGELDYITFAKKYGSNAPKGTESTKRLCGFFSNFNYSIKDVYLIDFSARLDGSSQFGSKKRFAPFYSLGFAYNLHKASYWVKNDYLNEMKISFNYGQLGKASFAAYQANTSYQYARDKWYVGGIGAEIYAMGNEDLEWEKTSTYDLNLNLRMFKNKLNIYGSYYYKLTKDILADITLPYSNGFKMYKSNMGEVENKGFELTARYNVTASKELTWSVYGSIGHNKNMIKKISDSLKSKNEESLSNLNDKPLVLIKENQSITSIYAIKSLGIDPSNGLELFEYKDGSVSHKWDPNEQVVCGDSEPDFRGTLGTNIYYKRFSLNANFLYKYGGQYYNTTLLSKVENADILFNVDKRAYEDKWKKPGDVTQFKNIVNKNYTKASSRFIQDENVLQLKSLSIGYDFDKEKLKKYKLGRLKLSLVLNDILRLSTIKTERGISYPFARNINFNIQMQF